MNSTVNLGLNIVSMSVETVVQKSKSKYRPPRLPQSRDLLDAPVIEPMRDSVQACVRPSETSLDTISDSQEQYIFFNERCRYENIDVVDQKTILQLYSRLSVKYNLTVEELSKYMIKLCKSGTTTATIADSNSKSTLRNGKKWTDEEKTILIDLFTQHKNIEYIANEIRRSELAVLCALHTYADIDKNSLAETYPELTEQQLKIICNGYR